MVAVLGSLLLAGIAFAQAQVPVPPNTSSACRIALPYPAGQFSDCSPQFAAAYNFAFCSLDYTITALSAPPSGRALGEKSKSEAYKRAGITYGKISQALSDTDTHQRNTELAKKYFESLKGEASHIRAAIDYVNGKCNNVEAHHAEVLQQLIAKLKQESKPSR